MKATDKLKLILRMPISILQRVFYKKPSVLSDVETIDYIVKNKCSIARFGDGEFDLMCDIDIKFQKSNKQLKARLKQIAKSRTNNCLICIPDVFYKKRELYRKLEKRDAEWWNKCLIVTRGVWYKLFRGGFLGDANISRFYMEVNDKSRTEDYVRNLKKIWDNKDIVFVEGGKSRLGVGNDFFDNAKSIRRILCPSRNAFDKYDEILTKVIELTNSDDLIICALGPTATVLSYDLSQHGRRALDLGHIDVEYEWYKMGATEKISIRGKDVAESTNELCDVNTQLTDNVLCVIK